MPVDPTNLVATSIADLPPSTRQLDPWEQWSGQTMVHSIGGAMLGIAAFCLLTIPRRFTLLPYLLMMCYGGRQRIVIGGLDFDFLRLLLIVGMFRILIRGEYKGFRFHRIDWFVIAWTFTGIAAYTALHGGGGALTNRLGNGADTLGAFLVFRVLVRDWEDVRSFVQWSVLIAVPTAYFFAIERATGRNHFAIFGGVPEITLVRDGKLRCQGAFAHPILAGTFWASFLPLYIALLLRNGAGRVFGAIGLTCALFMVIASASSTPLAAVGVAIFGWMLFPLRYKMNKVQMATIIGLLVIHVVRQPRPVWHLITRIDLVGGSTGYHRYRLIDAAINRFTEWMLIGTPTTRHWGRGLFDVTNQYILEGVRGGALTLLFFVLILWTAFKHVGVATRATANDRQRQYLAWGAGVTIFTHAIVFIAVSYFGQSVMLYQAHLAMATGVGLAAATALAQRRSKTLIQKHVKTRTRGQAQPRLAGGPRPEQMSGPMTSPRAPRGFPTGPAPAGPWARSMTKRSSSNGNGTEARDGR